MDDEGSAIAPGCCVTVPLHVVDRADSSPKGVKPKLSKADGFKRGTDVAGALAGPDNVSK